jgi:hypothetical protein
MNRTYETEHVWYTITSEGILRAKYKPEIRYVDEPLARKIVADRMAFQGNKRYPLLVEESGAAEYTKDARTFFAGDQGVEGLTGIAILVHNWVTYATASFILAIQKPRIPTRIFRQERDAILWLQKIKARKRHPQA